MRLGCPSSLTLLDGDKASATAPVDVSEEPVRINYTRHVMRVNLRHEHVRCIQTKATAQVDSPSKFGFLTEQEYQMHPSKFKDLPVNDLKTIFGPMITYRIGNNLLRILQKQRITGTLDQEVDEPHTTPQLIAKGLQWLRQHYPLDEDAAIVKRVQDEDRQMEEEFIKDVEKYKNWKPQQRAAEDGMYGKSQFEELRKENKARADAREKQAEEIRQAHGNTAVVSNASSRAVLAGQKRESAEWVKRYKERAALSKMLEPPEMSLTRRLLPCTIFAAVFLSLCIIFANNYKPPIKEARFFPDIPPAAATISVLIAINVSLFLMWKLPFFWRFMNKNCLLIAATPYPPSVLGNTFSHQGFVHLMTNMAFLWMVGTKLHDQIGRGNFLAVYLASGVFASWISLVRLVLSKNLLQCTLGCSGAVTGTIAALLCLAPIPGDLTNPDRLGVEVDIGWTAYLSQSILATIVILEFVGIFNGIKKVDHFSHLGGYTVGVFSAALLEMKRENQIRRRAAAAENPCQPMNTTEPQTREQKVAEWRAPSPVARKS